MQPEQSGKPGLLSNVLGAAGRLAGSAISYCWTHATASLQVAQGEVFFWSGGSTPKRVQVDLAVTPAEFDGKAKLLWDTGSARVFDAPVNGQEIQPGALDKAHWGLGAPVYVEPLKAGAIALSFSLEATGNYWLGEPSTVAGTVNVTALSLEIKADNGVDAPVPWVLAPNKRGYKAVLTPSFGQGTFTWSAVQETQLFSLENGNKQTVTAKPSGANAGTAKLRVTFAHDGRTLVAEHDVTLYQLRIKGDDGKSAPAKHVLVGKIPLNEAVDPAGVDVARKFTAAFEPEHPGAGYAWGKKGSTLYSMPIGANAAQASLQAVNVGKAEISLTARLDALPKETGATVEHAFEIVDVSIKAGDGKAEPKGAVLRQFKNTYKALPADIGTVAWSVDPQLSIVSGADQHVVEVTGREDTPKGEKAALTLKYTVDGQTVTRKVDIEVTGISVQPMVIALDRKNGSTVELEAKGTPQGGTYTWAAASNTIEAAVDGPLNQSKVKVKATKAGVAGVSFTCKHPEAVEDVVVESTAVFIGERIKSLTPEAGPKKDIAEDAQPDDKTLEVLLGLPSDPDTWKTGHVVAEAEGTPAKLAIAGLPKESGTHAWKPRGGGYLQLAPQQPAEHGNDKSKVLLVARPKGGNNGPPADPGYEEEKNAAEVTYTLFGKQAKDALNVKVHRFGCSQVTWQRKGKAQVDHRDRLAVCTHRGAPQWNGQGTWTDPPGGTDVGVVDILKPGGHQHGGRCFLCSGAPDAHTGSSPRHVWHHLPVTPRAFNRARAVANAVRSFALDKSNRGGTYSALLTDTLWDYLRPKKRASAGHSYRASKSKMLGVLVGQNQHGANVWLYALSGYWNATAGWCAPIDLGNNDANQRELPSFAGNAASYRKAQSPFNITVMEEAWGKLGRCAAPALLAEAMNQGLKNLELAEVWLSVQQDPSGEHFTHNNEIGSCEQCRRILGRLLCEAGD